MQFRERHMKARRAHAACMPHECAAWRKPERGRSPVPFAGKSAARSRCVPSASTRYADTLTGL